MMGRVKYAQKTHFVKVNKYFPAQINKYLLLEVHTTQIVNADQGIMAKMGGPVVSVQSIIFVQAVYLQLHVVRITNHQLEATLHQTVYVNPVLMFLKMGIV
jgi:hypothetical protein